MNWIELNWIELLDSIFCYESCDRCEAEYHPAATRDRKTKRPERVKGKTVWQKRGERGRWEELANEDWQSRVSHHWNISHFTLYFIPSVRFSGCRFHSGPADWHTIFHQPRVSFPAPATVNPSLNDCHKSSTNPCFVLPYSRWQLIISTAANLCYDELI